MTGHKTLTSQMTRNELIFLCKQINPGALILTRYKLSWRKPSSLFSWLVRRATDEPGDKARVNHTAMFYGFEDGVPLVIESSWRVRKYPLINYMDRKGQDCIVAQNRHVSEHLGMEIVSFAMKFLNKRYGYLALIRIGLDTIFRSNFFSRRLNANYRELVCSSLAEFSYLKGGNISIVTGKEPGQVTPDDQYDEVTRWHPPGHEIWTIKYNGIDS